MPSDPPIARLVLENGMVFTGRAFGAIDSPVTITGEVVFNTAMTGYQEALTDPSYAGQILTMTTPMIGNYGITPEDVESDRIQVAGFVVRELSRVYSNHRTTLHLNDWLAERGILGLEGIDTRSLVRQLRIEGTMRGVISCDPEKSAAELIEMANTSKPMAGRNMVGSVSPKKRFQWSDGLGEWSMVAKTQAGKKPLRVLALDCGAKRNIYRHLVERGCEVHAIPHDITPQQIREFKPDGLFISNGPGDPDAVEITISTLAEVAGEFPTFGICLGHQLLSLALGAKTYKLKFGHRGSNQPVKNLLTGRVEITSQNHGFCVDDDSLVGIDCEMTHLNLNDGTVAGFRHRSRPIFSVQYHPESSPGPHDSAYLFDCFVMMMLTGKPIEGQDMVGMPFSRSATIEV